MQNCPNCQHLNPPEAAFCMNCGTKLSQACANCGTALSAGARFCMSCGQPASARTAVDETRLAQLAAAAPAPLADKMRAAHVAGERKLVSVLFADVVGSTALAEQMDAEEWTAIMNRAFERLSPVIYRYEGTIARLMGDAMLVFFGAPVAHEDDPVRAILAALDLLATAREYAAELGRARGIPFAMRVGLNTGLVVVGAVGGDLKYEYTAMGDAVNLAARMQAAADPDTILVADKTYRLAAPYFEFEDRGKISVKGKSEPVQVYRVIRARQGQVQARGIEGLSSPLVGRGRELDTLRSRIDELSSGRGQIVSVMGEAGLGKSRLVAELRKSLYVMPNTPYPISWYEGRSLSYETSTSYAPFIDLFSSLFDLRADGSDAAKYGALRRRVAELFPEDAAPLAPLIATLLNLQPSGEDFERVRYLEPPQLRERVFRAVVGLIERLAQLRPVVLVFEDLHWIDPTSLDLLERLLPLTDRVPLMLLALFRPRRQEPSWRFHEAAQRDYAHRYTPVALEPLDDSHSRELVANLLQIEDLPETVRALILRKAEGNPFFVEEVIRSLLDAKLVVRVNSHWRATREIENIALPDTLSGVIGARLDRLDDDSKRVAQTASVIGREFQADVLTDVHEPRQVVDGALRNLQRRELIRQKSLAPQRAYLFKHVLTQEAAYASMLISQRRDMHRRVAECLERTQPDRVADMGRHFLAAQDYPRALPYLVEAGDRAARVYATPEAVGYYRQALDIMQKVDDLPLARRTYEGLGRAQILAGDIPGAIETYQSMLSLAAARGDAPMRVSALNKLSMVIMWLGQFQQVEQHLTDAERLAREFNDVPGLAEMYTVRCGVCLTTADFDGAVKYLGQSVEVGRALNLKEPLLFGLAHLSNTMTYLTRFEEAWRTADECRRLAEQAGDRQYLAEVLSFPIPYYHLSTGDLDAAQQSAEQGAQLAAHIGFAVAEGSSGFMLGTIALERGEYERALTWFRRMQTAARESGIPLFDVMALSALGSCYLDISETFLAQTIEAHTQALKLMEHPAGMSAGGTAWAELGFCYLKIGDVDQAGEFFHKGLSVPTTQMLLNKPRFLVGLALVALARNQIDEAARFVAEARTYVEERGMKNLYPLVWLSEARVSAARGDLERALEQFARAEQVAAGMRMRPLVWQAHAGAARVLSALGRSAEAGQRRHATQAVSDEIAGLFEDEKLRTLYVESAAQRLQTLLSG